MRKPLNDWMLFIFAGVCLMSTGVSWSAPLTGKLLDQECLLVQNMDCKKENLGTTPCPPKTRWQHKVNPLVELKAGYFFFSDSKMRKTYNAGGLDLQLSGSFPVWRWLQIYGSVEYFKKHGRIPGSHTKTSFWEVPLSLGLKPVVVICREVHYYFTLGPRYFFAHQTAHSPYLERSLSQNGLGGFVNTGFNFFPMRHFCIDIFGEYSYKRMKFHPHKTNVYGEKVQVGGFAFGVGLGYVF